MYLSDELTREERQHAKVQQSIDSLQKDMVRLNSLLVEKRGLQGKLEQSNILLEKDFIHNLKVNRAVISACISHCMVVQLKPSTMSLPTAGLII